MKKTLLFAALIAISAASASVAQQIPDSIFNTPSQAFGNTISDVPPDILGVSISPAAPAAGKPVTVDATIAVDPAFSIFKVKRAQIVYSSDGKKYLTSDMKLANASKNLWRGKIPAFPAGTTVSYSIAAWDEIGNSVWQLPKQSEIDMKNLFKVIVDETDHDIPANLDILWMGFGTDGTNLNYCQNLRAAYQSYTILGGVTLSAMGFLDEDVRIVRRRSGIENNVTFLTYLPALNMSGKMRFEDFDSGPRKDDNISVYGQGRRVCAKAPISALTSIPAHGLKVFSATASLNPTSGDGMLVDASPYAILYFGGKSYTVK